ncbi:MAG: phosphatase [Firmicutes bacterium]|nr:phosphatase [Bacillota bacterium]
MKIVADLHVHTVASGHAYSTVLENVRAAADSGLELIAITDHGPSMQGGPHVYHFSNLRVLPRSMFGVEILRGIEANIIDTDGAIDLPERFQKYMDIVLAGFHAECFRPASVEENTRAMVGAIAGGQVDVIVHPGNPAFLIDPETVARAAAENNVALEINNTSLQGAVRKGSRENCSEIAAWVAKSGGKISIGSDAHFATQVGELSGAVDLALKAGIKPEQVLNTSPDLVNKFLRDRGRRTKIQPTPVV